MGERPAEILVPGPHRLQGTVAPDLVPDLFYLATPYSNYATGIIDAWKDACRLTARLIREGIKVYSPIALTHPVALFGDIDPYDHGIWLPFDGAMMAHCDALIVAHLPGWESSKGIAHEVAVFKTAAKPILDLDPDDLKITRRK